MNIVVAVVSTLVLFGTVHAQSGGTHAAHHSSNPAGAASSDALTDGEVRKVDKDAGKLTIKHGEIKNLEMPPMTMVFRVKDPALLDQVKPGDRVRFRAEKIDGAFTVTNIAAGQ